MEIPEITIHNQKQNATNAFFMLQFSELNVKRKFCVYIVNKKSQPYGAGSMLNYESDANIGIISIQ